MFVPKISLGEARLQSPVKPSKAERRVVGSLYRMCERINPFQSYFEGMITEAVLKAKVSGEFLLGDLHTHSVYSDGVNTPDHIVRKAKTRGLDVVAITDHELFEVPAMLDRGGVGSYPAHFPSLKEASLRYGVVVIPGIEVYSSEGHVLALFASYEVTPEVVRVRSGLSARETVELIHLAGGVAAAAHVYRRDGLRNRVFGLAGFIDGVEECNASAGFVEPTLAERVGAADLAGSDSHSKLSVGLALTLFPKVDCPRFGGLGVLDDLLDCIRRRRTRTHMVPVGGLWRSADKVRWLNPFYVGKSVIQLFNDMHRVVGRRVEALLVE